jgi:hypothetical protein
MAMSRIEESGLAKNSFQSACRYSKRSDWIIALILGRGSGGALFGTAVPNIYRRLISCETSEAIFRFQVDKK